MGMIKNILGNIDFNQIGDMMQKVSGDENSSKEFGEVFGKISDTIKGGGNPLEAMNDIIKQVTVNAAMGENSHDDRAEDTGGDVAEDAEIPEEVLNVEDHEPDALIQE